jgi:hypothetical protein
MSTLTHHYITADGERIEVPQPPADPNNCSMDELERYLYRQNYYEECVRRDEVKKREKDPAYQMPLEDLRIKAELEGAKTEAEELENYRTSNAWTFMASCPRYKKTPANATILVDELNRLNMRGSVSDFQYIFDELDAQRKIETNWIAPTPKKIWTREELSVMPLEDAKSAIEQMGRDGIF